jgi:hypothetical protein
MTRMTSTPRLLGLLLALSCQGDPALRGEPAAAYAPAPAEAEAFGVPLGPERLLRRMSLDLRGTLPTEAELDALAAEPVSVQAEALFADPRFEERLVYLYAQAWRTQVDEFLVLARENPEFHEDPTLEYPFERAVGEEPLRLMARVAAADLPWSTIVTADWTMANEVTGPLWPLDYPVGGDGWQAVHYTDHRPAAGVLATNGLWWRYFSTVSNYNRGRAAAISRLLLCEDYSARPVTLSASASASAADIEDNLRTNPYCLGCHASLDPMATALFGFWPANEYNLDELERYHPEREPMGEALLGVTPAYYGIPFTGLGELGALIAADPRFARCTAETAAALLWRRPVVYEDEAELAGIVEAYAADGRYTTVLQAVVAGPRYQLGGFSAAATDTERARERAVRILDAPLLASVLEDLTGFTWLEGGFDQLRNDILGYRLLGGGVDGFYATRSQDVPGLTWLALMQSAAEASAAHAVERELVAGGEPRLFMGLTLADRPGDPAFVAGLRSLHRRLYADLPDEGWISDVGALWSALEAEADGAADARAAEAWRGSLAALLQDPRFMSY